MASTIVRLSNIHFLVVNCFVRSASLQLAGNKVLYCKLRVGFVILSLIWSTMSHLSCHRLIACGETLKVSNITIEAVLSLKQSLISNKMLPGNFWLIDWALWQVTGCLRCNAYMSWFTSNRTIPQLFVKIGLNWWNLRYHKNWVTKLCVANGWWQQARLSMWHMNAGFLSQTSTAEHCRQ